MKSVLLYVMVLGLLITGVAAKEDRKPLRCKKPAGNLWSSILNKDCRQSVCMKTGSKATWKQCPKAATEEVIKKETKNLKEVIENQTKKLDEIKEFNENQTKTLDDIQEVDENQTKKLYDIQEVNENQTKKLDDMQEVIENQTKKLDKIQEVMGKIMEKIGHNCGEEHVTKTTTEMTASTSTTTNERTTTSTTGSSIQDDILFIGPTYQTAQTEVFLIPSFKKPKCKPPQFPSDYRGYHARMTPDGPLLCGGAVGCCHDSSCYLPTNNGSWTKTPSELWPTYWSNVGHPGSSVEFEDGWWVAGEDSSGKTFIWDGSSWQNYIELPKPLIKFCMAKINSTHIFLSGGEVYSTNKRIQESYIYSKATGFVQIANMRYPRVHHGCGLHDEKYVFVAGGGHTTSEYFDLESMTWHEGPYVYVW